MKRYSSFIIIENVAEWDTNKRKDNFGSYWLCGAMVHGLPNTIIKENFPLIFQRFDSSDPNFADTLEYIPIDEGKAYLISSMKEYILYAI